MSQRGLGLWLSLISSSTMGFLCWRSRRLAVSCLFLWLAGCLQARSFALPSPSPISLEGPSCATFPKSWTLSSHILTTTMTKRIQRTTWVFGRFPTWFSRWCHGWTPSLSLRPAGKRACFCGARLATAPVHVGRGGIYVGGQSECARKKMCV